MSSWRRLTGGRAVRDKDRPTLVACSGGADSSALLLALSTVSPPPAVAHIVHDMRPDEEAKQDLELTADLCARLGLSFHEGRVRVRAESGNTESNARRARYRELASIARRSGCGFVATGHHADDQLETVLMRMIRGTGVRGLSGIHPVRALDGHATLIRPMLCITRDEALDLCRRCGWQWAEDRTNSDISRRRAAIRKGVVPALLAIEPNAARHCVRMSEVLRLAHDAIASRAEQLESGGDQEGNKSCFSRIILRDEDPAVLTEFILRMHHSKMGGGRRDRIHHHSLTTCIGAICDDSGEMRIYNIGGLRIEIDSSRVCFY